MGPRLFRRGNVAVSSYNYAQISASMGPRLFRRGNPGCTTRVLARAKLQWGHAFSDVEILYPNPTTDPPAVLQWGHAFSDVEILGSPPRSVRPSPASMGPRLFRRGNEVINQKIMPFIDSASMGPRLFRRGNSGTSRRGDGNDIIRFNGATPFQTWKWG